MHWIQQHVLRQLIKNPTLRYADIKPTHVEGSLFMYHLNGLKKEGLVQKTTSNRYELTPKGRLLADNMQLGTMKFYNQPRIIVLVACWDDKKGLLLFHRRTQPVINMIGFPHVSINVGENLINSAQQNFEKLSGLKVKLTHRGDGYITMFRGKEAESYVFFHLLEGKNPKGRLLNTVETGEFFWQVDPQLDGIEYLPSMKDLVDLLQSDKNNFFVEKQYSLA